LNLSSDHLNNVLPNNFFNKLTKLQILDLSNNALSGNFADVSMISSLVSLNMGDNYFTGTIPIFNDVTLLTKLDLGPNIMVDTLTSAGGNSITKLVHLQYLDLKSYSSI
jgi:hypothetical protein